MRWEGPHRIAQALAGVPTQLVHVLENEPLSDPSALSGAVVMDGPMSVNDTARYPDLAREKTWIERALADGLPLLGVCLGSQLIAEVLNAHVRRAARPELGWSPVTVTAPDDPVAGPLAPRTTVLHWHGEEFDVPPGAQRLAFSEQTGGQGFRHGSAWGSCSTWRPTATWSSTGSPWMRWRPKPGGCWVRSTASFSATALATWRRSCWTVALRPRRVRGYVRRRRHADAA